MSKYKLVAFDVDGTLLDNLWHAWQVFHDHFQVDPDKRKQAQEAFKKGDITYLEWAEHDVLLWKRKGVTKKDFDDAITKSGVKLVEGARETLHELKRRGVKLAIISGSLNVMVEHFIPDFEEVFDDVFFSWLEFDKDGKLVGVKATEYDQKHKATALKIVAEREGIPLEECVFIGDFANDVHALQEAGLGIGFCPNHEKVREVADVIVEKKDMREVLQHII